jgi:hypothetical protein
MRTSRIHGHGDDAPDSAVGDEVGTGTVVEPGDEAVVGTAAVVGG